MYFGTEYLSNIKDEALLKRLLPFTINEVYPNWATFLSLCFDNSTLSNDEVKQIVKKYSKRPPLRTIEYYCKKYNVARESVVEYCIWLYYKIGYRSITSLRIRQMVHVVFKAPLTVTNLNIHKHPFYTGMIHAHRRKEFFIIINLPILDMFWKNMFTENDAKKVYVAKDTFDSYGKDKGWIVPKYLKSHKAKTTTPFDFNPINI